VREERTGYTVLMWLLIKRFTEKDVGSYKCVSTNSLGRADGTLRLYGEYDRAWPAPRCSSLLGCRPTALSLLPEIKIGIDRSLRKDHVSIIGGE